MLDMPSIEQQERAWQRNEEKIKQNLTPVQANTPAERQNRVRLLD
jgi:hypothetical protein